MKAKTKFGFYVREISSIVVAVLMTAVNETIAFNASATRFLTASSEQYVA